MSRPKRLAAMRSAARLKPTTPSSAHYLGYVDDDETPEMIMRKFEVLERYEKAMKERAQKESANGGGNSGDASQQNNDGVPFDEKTLEKLFKETSYFNVSQLVQSDSLIDVEDELIGDEVEYQVLSSEEEIEDEIIDDDEMDLIDDDDLIVEDKMLVETDSGSSNRVKRKKRQISKVTSKRVKDVNGKEKTKIVSMEVTGDDGHIYTIKKKTKASNPFEPQYVRIPAYPMPLTWARNARPFSFPLLSPPPGSQYFETNVLDFDLESLNRNFVGVLIDPPWQLPNRTGPGYVTANDLKRLKVDKVCKAGLIFVWVEKETTADAVKLLASWGFEYVENLVWIKQFVNHKLVTEPYGDGFAKSKQTLLIFRKGEGFHMRHQRNPDVIFDFVKKDKYLTEDKPYVIYDIIETLLPDGAYRSEEEPGGWLELWAKKGTRRPGWSTIVQKEIHDDSAGSGAPSKN